MKLKLQEINEIIEGLNDINKKEMPMQTAYKFQKNSLRINDEMKTIQDMKDAILEKYRDHDVKDKELEEGKAKLKDEFVDKYYEDVEELNNIECDLDIAMIEIGELEGVLVSPRTLLALDKIIYQEEAEIQENN